MAPLLGTSCANCALLGGGRTRRASASAPRLILATLSRVLAPQRRHLAPRATSKPLATPRARSVLWGSIRTLQGKRAARR